MSRKDWLLVLALSVPWGCSFLFFKVLGETLPPLTIALGRVGIAASALTLALCVAGRTMRRLRSEWRGLLALGLLNNALPFTLFAWGETKVSSGMAAILNALAPILTVLVLRVVTGSPLGWNKVVGAVVGFGGVVVLVGPADAGGFAGAASCLLAAFSYALSTPIMARLRRLPPILVADGQLIASTLLLLPFAAMIERPWTLPMPDGATWAALLALALFSTAVAYVIYFKLVSSAGPANAMLVTYVIPVTALILGNLALGEAITVRALMGMGIILAGLALLDGRLMQRKAKPA